MLSFRTFWYDCNELLTNLLFWFPLNSSLTLSTVLFIKWKLWTGIALKNLICLIFLTRMTGLQKTYRLFEKYRNQKWENVNFWMKLNKILFDIISLNFTKHIPMVSRNDLIQVLKDVVVKSGEWGGYSSNSYFDSFIFDIVRTLLWEGASSWWNIIFAVQ